MTTIVIVGAGPGLGAAVARRFGAEGFAVGLISRNQERVDGGAIVAAGDQDKDPEVLAGILWDLHAERDRFRVEVATG